jgi:hypothetical protein
MIRTTGARVDRQRCLTQGGCRRRGRGQALRLRAKAARRAPLVSSRGPYAGVCRVRVRAPIASARNNKEAPVPVPACPPREEIRCTLHAGMFGSCPGWPGFLRCCRIHTPYAALHHCVECVQFRSPLGAGYDADTMPAVDDRSRPRNFTSFRLIRGAMIDPDLARRSGTDAQSMGLFILLSFL